MLQTVRAAGFALPAGDDGRLRVRRPLPDVDGALPVAPPIAPGGGAPRAACPGSGLPGAPRVTAVDRLVQDGWHVALTGGAAEQPLTGRIAVRSMPPPPASSTWAVGSTSPQLAAVLDRAEVTVVGQHRPRPPGRGGRHPGGLAVRAGGAGAALGTLRSTGRAAR